MTATATGTLYIALELGQDKWLMGCATQAAQKPRLHSLPARDLTRRRGSRADRMCLERNKSPRRAG
jgi:hypothetical protein